MSTCFRIHIFSHGFHMNVWQWRKAGHYLRDGGSRERNYLFWKNRPKLIVLVSWRSMVQLKSIEISKQQKNLEYLKVHNPKNPNKFPFAQSNSKLVESVKTLNFVAIYIFMRMHKCLLYIVSKQIDVFIYILSHDVGSHICVRSYLIWEAPCWKWLVTT